MWLEDKHFNLLATLYLQGPQTNAFLLAQFGSRSEVNRQINFLTALSYIKYSTTTPEAVEITERGWRLVKDREHFVSALNRATGKPSGR
ncbi:MAG: hypothetical protein PHC60_00180 [Heliobacteriaceae bacterium]|nr:hypothetical protein [Heliobacteriaceae bacterium]MDD4586800.1 hypothetical protein [Heliobacteriaceae bacterium]